MRWRELTEARRRLLLAVLAALGIVGAGLIGWTIGDRTGSTRVPVAGASEAYRGFSTCEVDGTRGCVPISVLVCPTDPDPDRRSITVWVRAEQAVHGTWWTVDGPPLDGDQVDCVIAGYWAVRSGRVLLSVADPFVQGVRLR